MKKYFILFSLFYLFTYDFSNAQWVQTSNGFGNNNFVYSLIIKDNIIFMGSNRVYLSTNYGNYWTQALFDSLTVSTLATNGSNIFAGTNENGVYLSTNNGSNWTHTASNNIDVWSLTVSGNNIIIGSPSSGIFLSSNSGQNWLQIALNDTIVNSLITNGNTVFAGTYYHGVYKSTNNGINWIQTTFNNQTVWSFAISGNNIFAGTSYNGIFISTNNGLSWTQSGLNNQTVISIAINGNNIFAGTYGGGIFLSKNNGINWIQKNEGFPVVPSVNSLLIANSYLYAGTQGQSVWKRPISDLIGIRNISTDVPAIDFLSQNYPNPFNPNTIIRYNIKQNSDIRISIYDLLGKEIDTPVNEKQSPGEYEVSFDGSKLNSGIYFCSLYVNRVLIDIKRMVLIK